MFGIAVEYRACAGGAPDPLVRLACQAMLAGRPGYRQRLALVADGWRRVVDLFLFASPEEAAASLSCAPWRAFVAAHPACRDACPALLVSAGYCGQSVILLRGKSGSAQGGQICWRDHLARAEPDAILW
ncbi:MAG: hypothetical protein U0841_11025 [Chloroflexia bacterium]